MNWEEFKTKIISVMNSRGIDYVSEATTTDAEDQNIVDWYTVPIRSGSPGYVNKHGQRIEFI